MHPHRRANPRPLTAGCIAVALACASTAAQTPAQTPPQLQPAPYAIVSPPPTRAQHAMVVSVHHDASDAGVEVLKAGGNAVDAAVAVGFALAVVFPQAGNLGGGGFMLIRMHTGAAHFIDYREQAPAAATAAMYLDAHGNIVPGASTLGYKAIGVPGTVAGLVYAEKTYGRLGLARVIGPAIRLATECYILSDEEARDLAAARNLAAFPVSRRIFQRNGNFFKSGDRFTQPQLAATLRRIAADPKTFYTGAMAAELAASVQQGGGPLPTPGPPPRAGAWPPPRRPSIPARWPPNWPHPCSRAAASSPPPISPPIRGRTASRCWAPTRSEQRR